MTIGSGGQAATDAPLEAVLEDTLLQQTRRPIDLFDALGVGAVTVLIVVALRDVVGPWPLSIWAVGQIACIAGWSDYFSPRSLPRWLAVTALWASSVLWAALPWFAFAEIDDDYVTMVLLAVVGYGLATDAIMVPQSVRLHLTPMMLFYSVSYFVAFTAGGRWIAAIALAVLTTHLAAGAHGIERIKRRLIEMQAAAEERAGVDELTGVASRHGLMRELRRRIARGEPVHCLTLDIDDFKTVTTHLGQQGGEAMLRELATQLVTELDGWVVGRLDGDEFAAVGDRPLTVRQRESLPSAWVSGSNGVPDKLLHLSVGVSSTALAADPDEVLRHAGVALERAKREGKGRLVEVDRALLEATSAAAELDERVRSALARGEIVPWAQPIVDLEAREWAGLELLARWHRSDGSVVTPGEFLPAIERQGLTSRLGDVMIDHAIDLLIRLSHLGHRSVFVTVNLTAIDMIADDLAERLHDRVVAAGVEPSLLVLEMTETERLPDPAAALPNFHAIRTTGIGIASDDVGSGWSSINQLLATPFSHVKIDRGLIDSSHRRGGAELIAALRILSEGAGQLAVAEGIETPEELARVLAASFALGQGYLFAKPRSITDVLELLASPVPWPSTLPARSPAELDLRDWSIEPVREPRPVPPRPASDG